MEARAPWQVQFDRRSPDWHHRTLMPQSMQVVVLLMLMLLEQAVQVLRKALPLSVLPQASKGAERRPLPSVSPVPQKDLS